MVTVPLMVEPRYWENPRFRTINGQVESAWRKSDLRYADRSRVSRETRKPELTRQCCQELVAFSDTALIRDGTLPHQWNKL